MPPPRAGHSDRPTAARVPGVLVAASDSSTRPRFVVILPITHSPPSGDAVGIEIPTNVREAIGLDDKPCWVNISEHNVDEWPNAGLEPLPTRPGMFAYGFVPPRLFSQIKHKFLDLAQQNRSARVRR